MKEQLKAIEDSYTRFSTSIENVQILQQKLERTLQVYKAALEELAKTTSATEKLLDGHLALNEGGLKHTLVANAAKQMQETQMSFNVQYLQLQMNMQNENRVYTAVSNIMKTKHDTVKNSISNIR